MLLDDVLALLQEMKATHGGNAQVVIDGRGSPLCQSIGRIYHTNRPDGYGPFIILDTAKEQPGVRLQ